MEKMEIINAIASAGKAIVSMTKSVKSQRMVSKADAAIFLEQIRFIQSRCRVRTYGVLVRDCVAEMSIILLHVFSLFQQFSIILGGQGSRARQSASSLIVPEPHRNINPETAA